MMIVSVVLEKAESVARRCVVLFGLLSLLVKLAAIVTCGSRAKSETAEILNRLLIVMIKPLVYRSVFLEVRASRLDIKLAAYSLPLSSVRLVRLGAV